MPRDPKRAAADETLERAVFTVSHSHGFFPRARRFVADFSLSAIRQTFSVPPLPITSSHEAFDVKSMSANNITLKKYHLIEI